MRVGRNDPCPCGSGLKYKKCCLKAGKGKESESGTEHQWDVKEIEEMDTEDIISQLKDFGVDFKTGEFLDDVKRFNSAEGLSKHWFEKYPISATGSDEDFLHIAALLLWERLAPEVMNTERLGGMMVNGYELVKNGKSKDACVEWLTVWDHLKKSFVSEIGLFENSGEVFSGFQPIYDFCQNLGVELWNAGIEDPSFFDKRIEFCQEFCELVPDSGEDVIKDLRMAEAESYFMIGKKEIGDDVFKAIVEDYPEWEWGYIGWADMYADRDEEFSDPKKAEEIFRMGLRKASDVSNILDRLDDLDESRNKKQ